MRRYNFIVLIFVCGWFMNCKGTTRDNSVIHYGTQEFKDFHDKANIKLDSAWKIQIEYLKSHYDYKDQEPKGGEMYFCVGEYYVFKSYVNFKLPEVDVSGIWVNALSGEVKEVVKKEKVRTSFQGWKYGNTIRVFK